MAVPSPSRRVAPILAAGKVRGVDVEPSAGLDHKGIRACSRVAIWDTEFPAFDGADMVITYKLDID